VTQRWYAGLMSGTSFDGVDVALLKTDGRSVEAFGPSETTPLSGSLRKALSEVMGQPTAPPDVVEAVTEAHIAALEAYFARHGRPDDLAAIGFHGQTIFHRPAEALTVQIGDGARIARRFDVPVVEQVRRADVAAGGQGAPIAPIFHLALLRNGPLPAAFVNIGGVSNVTWTDGEELVAFDSGVGNARLDDWMRRRVGLDFDPHGRFGEAGRVHEPIVDEALRHPFYEVPPPKSLDRDELTVDGIEGLSTEDGAATLAAITAEAIARSARFLPLEPTRWIIAGGGRHNRAIMNRLRQSLKGAVTTAEDANYDGDGVEAQMMAYLAARSLAGLPISFPGTTGVPSPMTGGELRLP